MTITVDIRERPALLVGQPGPLADTLAAALSENGAVVRRSADGSGETAGLLVLLALAPGFDASRAETILRAAAVDMPEGGRMIVVASVLGLVTARGEAGESVRAAGLFALVRALAMEFAARGIVVNAVAVGPIGDDEGVSARMISHVPLKRGAHREDVATAILFLADPDNSYMTGHVLTVDGGWTAGFARDF